jgi:hypothetical protein
VKRTIFWGLIVVVIATVVLGVTPALAAPAAPNGARLENLLKREQILLTNQSQRLALSGKVIAKADEWINNLKDKGKDVSALEAALSDYKAASAKAAADLDTAKGVLGTHAGFDSSGQVTDASQALKTLRAAGKAERQLHLTIAPAAIGFRAAGVDYRQANK